MSMRRSPDLFASIAVTLQLAIPSAAAGQVPNGHDHGLFECAGDGLSRKESTGFGCERLAKYEVPRFADGPLFWHITKLPAKPPAASMKGQTAFVVDAEGQTWLFSFGPEDAVSKQGHHVATVGPLPLTPAKSYAVVAYFVVMPVGAYTMVHTHPGPEAWYVLDGAQCLDTPGGALRVAAGQTGVAPPDTPMQLHNSGSATRRALFIVVHDAAQPWGSPSDWKPSGACGAD
jgi:quercetin dioxygenase-like cupin family protein